ncbi:STM3941 family protein [Robertmurraya sp. GLU-23]
MRMLFVSKPILTINEEGITDNTSIFKHGFIPWGSIVSINDMKTSVSHNAGGLYTIHSEYNFIRLEVSNSRHIVKGYSGIRRKVLEIRMNNNSPLISIPVKPLSIKEKGEVLQLMMKYHGKTIIH